MKVHVLTHTIVEGDPETVFHEVSEHLESQAHFAAIKARAIAVDITVPDQTKGAEPFVHVDTQGAWLEKVDDGLALNEIINLAASSIAAAQELERQGRPA